MKSLVFVVAVSGGVDSVVLLHMLATRKSEAVEYVVAHVDHGMRDDSAVDANFVKTLAKNYRFKYEEKKAKLGSDASESEARKVRYDFLREVMRRHKAEKIVTAHHQDDLIETMIINILRGTGPRGLAVMQAPSDILRPLLNKTKQDLQEYAEKNKLKWREDSTNNDLKYLRNYVRKKIMPKLSTKRSFFVELNKKMFSCYHDIDMRIATLVYGQTVLNRTKFVSLPFIVQSELMRAWLIKRGVALEDRKIIERAVIAAKTLPIGKKIDLDGTHWLISEKQNLLITSK